MDKNKQPVEGYYYSEEEWDRLGCGPLPPERDRNRQTDTPVDSETATRYN